MTTRHRVSSTQGGSTVLIKKADDHSAFIRELERTASGNGLEAKRATDELRIRQAGLRGEAESAYLIDFDFANSRNWAVVHDLRLEQNGRVAQIDHLLINRWLDVYVLETKHFHAGLKITEQGEFLRYDNYKRTYLGMPSPLQQNERHIAVLHDVVERIEWPVRLGLRIAPSFHSLVLVASNARIDRPKHFDTSRVIKADQLKARIWKDIDDEGFLLMIKTAAKMVSRDTVEFVARQLVAQHRPLSRKASPEEAPPVHNRTRIEPTFTPATAVQRKQNTPTAPACKSCSGRSGEILHGKFGYYFKCGSCAANTAIRFTCQPGHSPRLRKEGAAFYRECAECNSSALFHRNGQ
ncbi:hypothetical protein J2X06_003324 [Lysobacter niastensis]|uniref:NERD domain-containing protein n=1 Tax=Lysobacter niastensis TaxID=380629 RepID=A0ABU1WES8_9GAMM|nr:nuclease-related domain-containing protein [Lysobacter niastensis]MDR7136106.1 hypothetical protein [Lysobacter niastensis]